MLMIDLIKKRINSYKMVFQIVTSGILYPNYRLVYDTIDLL